MKNRVSVLVAGTVVAGLLLCWSSWVSNSTVVNRIAIAETRQELKTEIKGISNTLSIHYGLLKEIRDDQKKRNDGSLK